MITRLIAGVAMIVVFHFHEFAYDLLSENEKIISSTTDVAIKNILRAKKSYFFLSSLMVFESTDKFPTKEDDLFKIPPF